MPLPTGITAKEVHMEFVDSLGVGATGTVSFTPSEAFRGSTGTSKVVPVTHTVTLVAGAGTIDLPATNSTGLVTDSGDPLVYNVVEQLSTSGETLDVREYTISVDKDATEPIELGALRP